MAAEICSGCVVAAGRCRLRATGSDAALAICCQNPFFKIPHTVAWRISIGTFSPQALGEIRCQSILDFRAERMLISPIP